MPAAVPQDDKRPAPRRDAVGVVLSAVTTVVLVVGVLVIRSTRSDLPVPLPAPADNEQAQEAPVAQEPKPGVLIAWPSNRTETL